MLQEEQNTVDAWLRLNLRSGYSGLGAAILSPPASNFLLLVLPLALAISAFFVALIWYQKTQFGLTSVVDHIGYPVLLLVTSVGAILLKLRPDTLRFVMGIVFSTYIAHLLVAYYMEMAHRLMGQGSSSYELTMLALWLPLGYVGSFVFFSPRVAVRASLTIYAAVSLPQLAMLVAESDAVSRLIAIAILISQPLYIVALWGVGLLKKHARGIYDLAKSMRDAATVDALTGIANRRAIDHVLESVTQEVSHASRDLAVLMLDVDHFKRINDSYGHATGDQVLVRLAQEAGRHLRKSDLLSRWGGEEFMVIALDQSGPMALQMAERLRSELEMTIFPSVGRVTISIGVTSYIAGEGVDACIERADKALYLAKENGRNRVEGVFDGNAAR